MKLDWKPHATSTTKDDDPVFSLPANVSRTSPACDTNPDSIVSYILSNAALASRYWAYVPHSVHTQ